MKKIFPLLGLIMAAAHAASPPLISNEARYCYPGTEACASLEVVSINSDDPALNKLADELLTDELFDAQGHSFDRAGLEKMLCESEGEVKLMPEKPEGKIDPAEKDAYDYHHRRVVSQVGESEHYWLLEKYESFNNSGAGGESSRSSYYLVSKDKKEPVQLADILLPDQRPALEKLQRAAWQRYQDSKKGVDGKPLSKEELKERLETYPFTVSKQWRLAKDGLVFLYQPEEMDDWVAGNVEITVPATELKDVIKPEFIKEMASWQDTPPEKDQDDLPKATAKPDWRKGE